MTGRDLPEPEPGDTARLDQLGAAWRDAPPDARAAVEAAAATARDTPSAETVAALMEALATAGLTDPDQPRA